MNTKTAPEANTGRIVSKFWPSSLFIFVNSSWWFSASLVTSSCKRIWEVQTDLLLEQYMTHTWQQGNLSLTQSLSSVRESKMEDGVAETSTVHVCYCTFQCPPQCSKGFLVYGFGGNFSLGIQWVVPSVQDLAHLARSSSHHYYNEYYCWLLLLYPVKFAAWIN